MLALRVTVGKCVKSFGLAAVLASLWSCGKQSPFEDTSALEVPPPKPPNCNEGSGLEEAGASTDGFRNVRVIQFTENAIFYVPKEWLRAAFVDKVHRPGGFAPRVVLERFSPDIHEDECPGVVHNFVEEAPGIRPDGIRPMVSVEIRPDLLDQFSNFSLKGNVSQLAITADGGGGSEELAAIANGGGYNAFTRMQNGVLIFLRTSVAIKSAEIDSAPFEEFITWLATPPASRDGGQTFSLKVESQ